MCIRDSSKGLGGSMIGTYAYYLASPLNLLVVFFSKQNLYIFFATMVILKLGLSSLFMYIYVSKRKIKQSLKLIAVSYTHLDVYKRQVSHLKGYGIVTREVNNFDNILDKLNENSIIACLLYTSRCV